MRLLDRAILADLTRVMLLTTAVLVTVIAFGATIKPLAHDHLLSAGQTIKYVGLAIIPMLQFALPFAAGFAGTMTLHRMTTDNEVLAAAASGLSYRRLLLPLVGLGLVLTLIMVLLTQWVIPRFWSLLERTVAMDVTRIFQASIERGDPFQFGDMQIFADEILVEPDPGGRADTRLVLLHVAAADLAADGSVDRDVTASRAVVDVYREAEATYLRIAMEDTVAYDPDDGVLAWARQLASRTIAIDNVLTSGARTMTRGQLLALRENPDGYKWIEGFRNRLADSVRQVELWDEVDRTLRADGAVTLVELGPEGRRYEVHADSLRRGRFQRSGKTPIEIIQHDADGPERRLRAQRARLTQVDRVPDAPLAFDLNLTDCEVTNLQTPQASNRRRTIPLENLTFEGFQAIDLSGLTSAELLDRSEVHRAAGAGALNQRAEQLERELVGLQNQIASRLMKRYAMSVTAILLLLLGAVLAMWRRNSQPLAIYLWAFLPSILDLILISSGDHLLRDGHRVTGPLVMWSGNATLVLLLLGSYRQLARN
ncbi:MAG: LptF/LptG family permease [Phycisphaerales bacterium]|nr:LptF/LptG family permease [Phycisphaerales bacterium]